MAPARPDRTALQADAFMVRSSGNLRTRFPRQRGTESGANGNLRAAPVGTGADHRLDDRAVERVEIGLRVRVPPGLQRQNVAPLSDGRDSHERAEEGPRRARRLAVGRASALGAEGQTGERPRAAHPRQPKSRNDPSGGGPRWARFSAVAARLLAQETPRAHGTADRLPALPQRSARVGGAQSGSTFARAVT